MVAARRDFPSKRKDDGDASDERVEFRSTAPIPIRLRWTGRISSGQQHFSQLFCWGSFCRGLGLGESQRIKEGS